MALAKYVTGMFFPDEIARGETDGSWGRLLAFAAIQRALDEGMYELTLASFALPRSDDNALADRPEVAATLFDDGLVRLSSEHARAAAEVGENVVVVDDGLVLYPHRLLAGSRELVRLLFELAALSPELEVRIAVDPYKSTGLAGIPHWLMEDYWHGPRLTAAALDSLDAHDLGATSTPPARAIPPRSSSARCSARGSTGEPERIEASMIRFAALHPRGETGGRSARRPVRRRQQS